MKGYGYTSTHPLGLRGLLYGEPLPLPIVRTPPSRKGRGFILGAIKIVGVSVDIGAENFLHSPLRSLETKMSLFGLLTALRIVRAR